MSSAEQAVNVFGALISLSVVVVVAWELKLQFIDRRAYYRFADSGSNLYTLVLYTLLGSAAFGFIFVCYEFVRSHAAVLEMRPDNLWAWIGGFVLTDFCHYWFHRAAHRNNLLWGIHQGHHTSEDFNLSTALRKGIFQQWVDWPFFLPMALLGFPFFEMYLPLKGLQFAYQFWLHNQFIGKLGPVERILVTPSLHRVHHGQNPEYIDRNYAGVFILWDKLFGSFTEEVAPVRYGVTTPVNSFNPVGYQFTWWVNVWRDATASRHWWERLRIWFMPVGWRPADRRQAPWPGKRDPELPFEKFDLPAGLWVKVYAGLQLALIGLSLTLLTGESFDPFGAGHDALVLGYVVWTSWSVGVYFNHQPHAFVADLVRNVVMLTVWVGAYVLALFPPQTLVLVIIAHSLGIAWQVGCLRSRPTSPAMPRAGSPEAP